MSDKLGSILLVEDSVDDFEATVRAFKKANLVNPLVHAVSGEQAFEYLRHAAKPCLILLDLNMPGMGGCRFLEKIKQDEELKGIPVVILTTSSHEPDIKTCYALGANAYILKSADFGVLATAIKRLKEHWLDTVVLPNIFDQEAANTKAAFSISSGIGPLMKSQPDPHAVHLSPADVKRKIIGHDLYKPLDEKSKLTPNEVETLIWIARGKSRWETGIILGISEDAVKARLEKCRLKLNAANTTQAIAIALLHGLLND
jgi:two-component system response regulator